MKFQKGGGENFLKGGASFLGISRNFAILLGVRCLDLNWERRCDGKRVYCTCMENAHGKGVYYLDIV